ncbi:MAG: PSD1 and planctomycete cytochrome C domain-containing protein [Gemmataceae bacterium]
MTSLPAALVLLSVSATPIPPPGTRLNFEQHVRPLLKAHCLECHGEAKKLRGGLDLRLRRLMVQGGDNGASVVPGKPEQSIVFQRVSEHTMPPGKVKLTPAEVGLLRDWIAQGAVVTKPEPEKLAPGVHFSDEERNFWAFRPIVRPAVPVVRQKERVRNPVDAFLLARLEEKGLGFAPEADRATLQRRLAFDLVGLPPLSDAVGTYEEQVERLLASPQHGERWGRHWLDVAGYADSHGYTGEDPERLHAWKYRDWVIRAFNADKPYSEFLVEQLAGDELLGTSLANLAPADRDRLIATGFLRTAPDGTASPGVNVKEAANQLVADTLQIVGTSVMGMTLHCAQCHNHRYDPIPQTDYFRLRAVFEPAYDPKSWRSWQGRRISLLTQADRDRAAAIEKEAQVIDAERLKKQTEYIERTFQKQIAKVPEKIRPEVEKAYRTPAAKRTAAQQKLLQEHPSVNVSAGSLYLYDHKAAEDLKAYTARAEKIRATKPVEDFLDALTEVPGKIPVTHLFNRGDPEQPREAVTPGGLSILNDPPIVEKDSSRATSGRRLALARHLVSGKHPLTARVIVNRVWMHHFGRGLVHTPGDLGQLGDRPTHPELLDWLASEFMQDWSLKRLHRLLVTSSAYRQSARLDANAYRIDPDNKLLWRMSVRRLEAEAVRDAILTVTGRLNLAQFGEPVPVMPDESGQVVVGVDRRDTAGYLTKPGRELGNDVYRRSVYIQAKRSMPLTVMETFDNPVPAPCCDKRTASTVAPQALLLMNSQFVVEQAGHFAERVAREAGSEERGRVRLAWRLALGKEPSEADLTGAVAYLAEQTALFSQKPRGKGEPEPRQRALETFCHALLSSNPFLYVD